MTPRGTTINLFDYWTTGKSDPDNRDSHPDREILNQGINQNHALKFRNDDTNGNANQYTGGNNPRTGIVENNLGDDGYPVLTNNSSMGTNGESLNYLFNGSSFNGKDAYQNVGGLLRVDNDGYYYYDCKKSFASFVDNDENSFVLYDTAAVNSGGRNDGQFFPFNSGNEVFREQNGQLSSTLNNANDSKLNHYFGLTMTTNFIQLDGGKTEQGEKGKDVTYNFSGDDDVWVFIDGVLVGDLGGIHQATSLEINFASGHVYVYNDTDGDNQYDQNEHVYNGNDVTLKSLFSAAGKNTDNFSGNTFGDNTYHTLKFFYLERGNTYSNMTLKYNLRTIPETNIQKVDQEGAAVQGATFNVYKADEDYKYTPVTGDGDFICQATTDVNGNVVLVDANDKPITFDDLWNEGVRYLVFDEATTPQGYRNTSPIHMRLEQLVGVDGKNSVVMLGSNQWTTGAYALPRVTTTAPTDITVNGKSVIDSNTHLLEGTLVAVIEKNMGNNSWVPVYGNNTDGWTVLESGATDENIRTAAQGSNSAFVLASGGDYQTELAGLPGRIQDYYWFSNSPKYRISFYYSESASLDQATGFTRVDNQDEFGRQFSATLYVPNIINRVIVQKTDQDGNPVNGAKMALFDANQVNVAGDGSATLKENATPIDGIQPVETDTLSKNKGDSIDLEGAAIFTNLTPGTYYAAEVAAPEGYVKSNAAAKIVVDNTGVYADAGVADDGVTVTRGVGRIVRSMVQFATDDSIDSTLRNIVATEQVGDEVGSWTDVTADGQPVQLHLTYAGNGAVLDYGPTNAGGDFRFTVDEGIPYLKVQQCAEDSDYEIKSGLAQNLGNADITSLFTGTTIVTIENQQVGALDVTKTVKGDAAGADGTFDFTVTFSHPGADGAEVTPLTQDEATAADMQLTVGNGQAQAVTVNDSGEVAFKLTDGQTAEFTNIPAGVTYEVTEAATAGYTTTYDDAQSGTIEFNKTATTTVTNTVVSDATLIGADNLVVTKNLVGRDWQEDDSFSFTLAADSEDQSTVDAVENGTVVLPENAANGSVKVTNASDPKTAAFGDITFKSEGTYKFVITENDSNVTGVSKDESAKHETGTVEKQNNALVANVVNDDSDELTFTNTADLTISAADALQITKNLHASADSASLVNAAAGAYQFTISAVDTKGGNQPTAADAAAKLGLTGDKTELTADSPALTQGSGDNKYVWSGSTNPLTNGLTFTAADRGKTFTYEISEVEPDPVADGYVYDTAKHTVTYTVSDDATAALSVTVRIDGGDPVAANATPTVTFDNYIKVATIGGDDTDTALKVQKTVNVETDKDFSFDLSLESAKDADGNDITGGVFETGADGSLVTFDGMTTTIDGAFNVDNQLTQTASFGKITFTKPGTYTFNVKETTTGTDDGWTYDTTTKTITVTVDKDMKVTVDPTSSTVEFTNTYGATGDLPLDGSGDIKLTKTLAGRDWTDSDAFTFTLSGKNVTDPTNPTDEGFKLPDTTEVTVGYADAVKAAGEGNATEGVKVPFGFDKITFSQTGTYEFTVTEGAIDEANVSNTSGTTVTYRVVVKDDAQDGELEVSTPEVIGQTGTGAFVNTYNPSAATAGLTATKTLNGMSRGISPDLFTFQIDAISAPDGVTAPMPSNAQTGDDGTYTVTNDVDGAINFGTFRFSEPGTYVYTVHEVAGTQTGVTYDNSTYTVVYEVTDHTDTGELTAEMTVHNGDSADGAVADAIVFANTYDPEDVTVDPTPDDTSTGFSGTKTVTDEHGAYGDLKAGDFQFTMTNVAAPEGVTAPEPSKGSTVDVAADGSFDFGTLTFSEPGTYTYEVREVAGSKDGVTYSNEVYTLSYTIEDQNGKLTVTDQSITNAAGEPVDGDALDFENIYNDGKIEYTIGGTKVLETNGYEGASLAQGAYTFVLVDENGNEVGRATNGTASGNTATFQFDPITHTEAGTHTYKVYELGADGQPGTGGTDDARVTHSDAVYTVTVTVSESNDGRGLSATADVQNADITFTNTYEPTPVVVGPSGSAKIAGTKVLNVADGSSRAMKAGEFEFVLLDGNNEVGRATNDENGNFVFDDITYDKAGTYRYTVSESDGGLGGISYDSTLYSVTVKVTENAETHALEAAVTYADSADASKPVDAMVFTNSYKAASTTATLGVSKELQKGTLADGQFTFKLTGSEGAPMPKNTTATNTAAGVVSFGTVTFDEVGEYDYTITEVNDKQDGITYDEDATRTIHVSVTDDGAGHLVATVSYGADGSHFVNIDTTGGNGGNNGNPGGGTGDNGNGGSGNGGGNADNGNGSGTGDGLPGTGDVALAATAIAAVVGVGAVAAGTVIQRRKRQ